MVLEPFLDRLGKERPRQGMKASITSCGIEIQTGATPAVVPFSELTSPARVLNWILQIASAEWAGCDHVRDFVRCLDDASRATFHLPLSEAICPCGKPRHLDWTKGAIHEQLIQNYPSA